MSKKILPFPRPRLRRIEEAVGRLASEVSKGTADNLAGFDRDLKTAVLEDMAEYAEVVVSAVERHRAGPGVHSWREGDLLTCMGWARAEYPYYRDPARWERHWSAFGVERKMTPAAPETATRLAATLGSFKEGRDTLSWLGLGELSVSKMRAETLVCGKAA